MFTRANNVAMVLVCLGVAACNQMLGTEEGHLRLGDALQEGASGAGGTGASEEIGGGGVGMCDPSAVDTPDDDGADSNCDGIDGSVALGIFVAIDGDDANPGTPEAPKATINAGIQAAQAGMKSQVLISEGTYNERVILAKGVSLYGGYSRTNNWARSNADEVVIQSGAAVDTYVAAVVGKGIDGATTLDHLQIQTGNATEPGASNYAVYCNGCTALTVRKSTITAGNGADGKNGVQGNGGDAGGPGANGVDQTKCSGSDSLGTLGGAGGTSACGANGGAGGKGGNKQAAGKPGGSGTCGTPGGGGGGTGAPGSPGKPGASGGPGGEGGNGNGGMAGGVSDGFWVGSPGGNGAPGGNGCSGGGGGGGGGEKCTAMGCYNSAGNGGGGGGAGGCGGMGGTGGAAGGGSFGIFAVNSDGLVLVGNTIASGNGGNGGSGAIGGQGGAGGGGGSGGVGCKNAGAGPGGDGGNGGAGGKGGASGGGAGGPSYGLYAWKSKITDSSNNLAHGNGGAGGTATSQGHDGAPGLSDDAISN